MLKLETFFRKIVVFGPQGSGKGTQAEILAAELNVPRIAPGDIYRKNIKEQTSLGKLAEEYINKGVLVPDKITNQLMAERLKEADVLKGFLLDGYPRNKVQLAALDEVVFPEVALEIWISDKEAVFRISGRRVCKCGRTYHLNFNLPKKEGVCDRCGEELFQRDDDKEAAVKKRLEIYHHDTELLLKTYLGRGSLMRINGEQPIPEVTKEIFQKLNHQEFAKE